MLPPVNKSQVYTVVEITTPTTLDWYRGAKLAPGTYELPGDWSTKIKSSYARRQVAAGVVKIKVIKPGELPITLVVVAEPVVEKPVEEVAVSDAEPVVIEDEEVVEKPVEKPVEVPVEKPKKKS